MVNNLRFYDQSHQVPDHAKKEIMAGRLKGKTDINPMFRIKILTEIFGPCGLGWWYVIKDERIIDDEITKQRAAFVDIDLYFRDPDSGEVSQPIPGTGGASFVAQERNGPSLSDECFKMALTDAISVSAKALGVAADVYWEKDSTKYSRQATSSDPLRGPPSPEGEGSGDREGLGGREGIEERPTGGPATEAQKEIIKQEASDGDYLNIMQKYGANLERLSDRGAMRVIMQIRANNAGAVTS